MDRIIRYFRLLPERIRNRQWKFPIKGKKQWFCFLLILFLLVGGLVVILRVERDYSILASFEKSDVSGTKYQIFGRKLFKYSPDGVTCVNNKGEVLWNSTFSIQSPIADICGTTAVVADQQGTSIYIFNEDGQIGAFETLLPIEKVKVAKQGVVAAVLEDEDVTWINFYDTSGGEIAKMRTSLKESGYPLDVALSPDGMKIMVSFLHVDEGAMKTNVCFYNFDAAGQAEENNLVSKVSYNSVVIPSVFFVDSERSVALRSDGFSVYRGKSVPEEKANVTFEEEILTTFHEEGSLGFVFKSDKEDYKYKIMVYNLNGRCVMKKYINMDYRQIKMEEGNIIVFNDKEFEVYGKHGRKRVSISYEKAIENVIGIPGLGKYMVVGSDSTEIIRVR